MARASVPFGLVGQPGRRFESSEDHANPPELKTPSEKKSNDGESAAGQEAVFCFYQIFSFWKK